MSIQHMRLTLALLLSLLIHASLLSLTFSGQGFGLPGFGFPWQDRRIEAPDLHVVVAPAKLAPVAASMLQDEVGQTASGGPAPTPSASRAPTPLRTAAAIRPYANAGTETATVVAPSPEQLRADRPGETVPSPIPAPAVIAVARTDETTWVVPATPALPTPAIPAAPGASSTETAMPSLRDVDDSARQDAARQEATRAENARLEADRRDAALLVAARLEAERQEAARRAAVLLESAQQAAAQQQAALLESARIEAARIETARAEAARAEAARAEAARVEVAQDVAARREATLRAIGRQLDDEAARRDAATAKERQSPSSSGTRRYRLFGRTDPNAEVIVYAEAWSRKIQMNMTFDMVRDAAKQPHTDPVVTVAVRSDGSVESVTFVVSSGVAALDEAIRRVVRSQTPYQVFPPDLAREFDVIEIRRTWYFDIAIRLY